MTTLTLNRLRSDSNGTFGEIHMNGGMICVTCELPWDNNKSDASCIPAGTYSFQPHNTPDHPNVWEAINVPGRSEILIHAGNTVEDTKGCILAGESFGVINGMPGILDSQNTIKALRALLPDYFTMTITEDLVYNSTN